LHSRFHDESVQGFPANPKDFVPTFKAGFATVATNVDNAGTVLELANDVFWGDFEDCRYFSGGQELRG
jgi:hypothetical protein